MRRGTIAVRVNKNNDRYILLAVTAIVWTGQAVAGLGTRGVECRWLHSAPAIATSASTESTRVGDVDINNEQSHQLHLTQLSTPLPSILYLVMQRSFKSSKVFKPSNLHDNFYFIDTALQCR